MAEVLSQNEIEALLSAMTTVEEEEEPNSVMEERMGRASVSPAAAQARSTEGKVLLPLRKRRRAAAGHGDAGFASALRAGAALL